MAFRNRFRQKFKPHPHLYRIFECNDPPSLGAVECREVHGTIFYFYWSPGFMLAGSRRQAERLIVIERDNQL